MRKLKKKVLFDLHTHTVATGHAFSTLKENIEAAKNKGLIALGTSDHFEGMEDGASRIFFKNYRIFPEYLEGIRLYKGVEANIMDYSGNLDIDQELLEKMDYGIAALHVPCIDSGSRKENTDAIIGAMKNPCIKIIAHPDDDRFLLDYERLVQAAKEERVVLEVNNTSLSENTGRINARKNIPTYLKLCKDKEVPILLSSDAHLYSYIGEVGKALKLLEELEFPDELVVNFSLDRLSLVLNL